MLSFRTRGNFVDFVHTDNTSLQVESVLMSLHNTSKAVDWSLPEDTTRINFTIDDISYDNILITDIDFDGVTMTAQADFKTNIETIFPGLAGGGGEVDLGYLVYTALLNQSGTSAPVATALTNTLGGTVVWTRVDVGIYNATLTGAFTANKTIIFIGDGSSDTDGKIGYIWVSANVIELNTTTVGGFGDDLLNGASIEIRVYP